MKNPTALVPTLLLLTSLAWLNPLLAAEEKAAKAKPELSRLIAKAGITTEPVEEWMDTEGIALGVLRGQILDPTPLVTLSNDSLAAEITARLSQQEAERNRKLRATGEVSERALQLAEATAAKDKLALEIARQRLALAWGQSLATRADLPALTAQLVSGEKSLIRIDLPPNAGDQGNKIQARFWSPFAAEEERVGDYLATSPLAAPGGGISLLFTSPARRGPSGQYAANLEARLQGAHGPALLFIPTTAPVRADGKTFVFRLTGDDHHPFEHVVLHDLIPVQNTKGEGYAVRAGTLKKGDRIVTRAATTLLSWETLGETAEAKSPEPAPAK